MGPAALSARLPHNPKQPPAQLRGPPSEESAPAALARPANPSRPATLNRRRRRSPGGERSRPLPPTKSPNPSPPSPLPPAIGLSPPRSLRRNRLLERRPNLGGLNSLSLHNRPTPR